MGELIQRSAEWMQQIVKRACSIAPRSTRDHSPSNRKPTEVTEIISARARHVSARWRRPEIDFVLQTATHLPVMDAVRIASCRRCRT